MINDTFTIIILIVLLIANAVALYLVVKKLKETPKQNFPKWEYTKEGIRFFNKNGEVIIENDKPLKK